VNCEACSRAAWPGAARWSAWVSGAAGIGLSLIDEKGVTKAEH
jgi:hypothetical protein